MKKNDEIRQQSELSDYLLHTEQPIDLIFQSSPTLGTSLLDEDLIKSQYIKVPILDSCMSNYRRVSSTDSFINPDAKITDFSQLTTQRVDWTDIWQPQTERQPEMKTPIVVTRLPKTGNEKSDKCAGVNKALTRIKHVQEDIEEIQLELLHQVTKEAPGSYAHLFNVVNENALANCLAELYRTFLGLNKKKTLPNKCTPLEFCVYLLVLCEQVGLGREEFLKNSVKPFIKFIQNKVILDIDTSDITFWNRVNKMRFVIKKIREGNHYTGKILNPDDLRHCDNYSVVEKTYFESEFCQGLKRLVLYSGSNS